MFQHCARVRAICPDGVSEVETDDAGKLWTPGTLRRGFELTSSFGPVRLTRNWPRPFRSMRRITIENENLSMVLAGKRSGYELRDADDHVVWSVRWTKEEFDEDQPSQVWSLMGMLSHAGTPAALALLPGFSFW